MGVLPLHWAQTRSNVANGIGCNGQFNMLSSRWLEAT